MLESNIKNDGLKIDTVFSHKQECIWTGDECEEFGHGFAWAVYFGTGVICSPSCSLFYARPVRLIIHNTQKFEQLYTEVSSISLRSSYNKLDILQVQLISNICIRKKDDRGFYGHSTINHSYEKESINGDMVVIDNTTGLMWHQSGSDGYMRWKDAKDWIKNMNSEGYAEYYDWRLPTVDETVSLLESSKQNGGLYINSVFSNKQRYIWTGDKKDDPDGAWNVYFYDESVNWSYVNGNNYVRPVRSGNRKPKHVIDKPSVTFDTSYRTLSESDVESILKKYKLFDIRWNNNGGFQNDYSLKSIKGNTVVIDNATGLMWHQSGSDEYMEWNKVKKWIERLNNNGYAGYNDWRLPTVEETASLLESSKNNDNLYIDPIFSNKQWWIWTGDKFGLEGAWRVYFSNGRVYWSYLYNNYFVRPVRSGK